MDSKRRARLRKEAQTLDAAVLIGKEGVTPGIIAELTRQLEAAPLVKVRLLRTAGGEAGGAERMADELAAAVSADLVEVRGHTAVYAKRKGRSAKR